MSDAMPVRGFGLVDDLPKWFIAGLGTVYFSGYMICLLFYSELGITEIGGDIFKFQYIYVGMLFTIFMLTFLIPFYFMTLSKNYSNTEHYYSNTDKDLSTSMNILTILVYYVYIHSVIYMVIFTNTSEAASYAKVYFTITLVAVPTLYIIIIAHLEDRIKYISQSVREEEPFARLRRENLRLGRVWGWMLLLLIAICDISFFAFTRTGFKIVSCLFGHFGILFYIMLGFGTTVVWRGVQKAPLLSEGMPRVGYWSTVLCSAAVFYFLAIVIFSFAIFPFIPLTKGGGDYTGAPIVKLVRSGPPTGDYILLYRSGSSLFLGVPEDGNGPCEWRGHSNYPKIVEVNTRSWVQAEYQPAAPKKGDCAFW